MNFQIRTMTMTAALAFAAIFALAPQVASADTGTIREYQRGVDQLVVAASVLDADVEALLSAARSKPEMACSDDLAVVARRGRSIVADLAGTGTMAPGMLRDRHEAATAELDTAAQTLQGLVDQCQTSSLEDVTERYQEAFAAYEKAMRPIRNFAARSR